jgi:hypothetical protein
VPAAAKPSAPAKAAVQAKADCPCNCPPHRKAHADARPPHMRRQARGGYYHYAAAAPFRWHGHWRVAPGDTVVPGAMAAPDYEVAGLSIEDRGWTGGVGMAPDGGGFIDGYGQAHFANGGSVENGPTYNSYGQSFQYNPSQAAPFQPRSMGGFAPPGSR